jgi:glycerol-3-phosphate acyltransferase PlsY
LVYILTALGAYLLGSIPSGFLVAKAKGVDIRSAGSGNIGATNALRVLGKPAGAAVLLLDAFKGYAACAFLAPQIFNWLAPHFAGLAPAFAMEPVELQLRIRVVAGLGAVLGHNYTCWLKFRGGKGVATTAGVYLALAPWAVLVALGVFLLAVLLTKYVSVGSMTAALALPATVWVMTPQHLFLCLVTTALGALAIYKHQSNLRRLLAGTENRLGKRAGAAQ